MDLQTQVTKYDPDQIVQFECTSYCKFLMTIALFYYESHL